MLLLPQSHPGSALSNELQNFWSFWKVAAWSFIPLGCIGWFFCLLRIVPSPQTLTPTATLFFHLPVYVQIIRCVFCFVCFFSPSISMHRNADVYWKSHHIKSSNIPFSLSSFISQTTTFCKCLFPIDVRGWYMAMNCTFGPYVCHFWKKYDMKHGPSVTGVVWWREGWKSAIGYWSTKDTGDLTCWKLKHHY